MRRRLFLSSSSAAVALTLVGCGGGGGGTPDGTTAGAAGAGSATSGSNLPVSAVTSTPVATAASGSGYPFGSRLSAYVAGTRPSQSNATMDAVLTAQYDAWKTARVVDASSVVAGGYAVQFSDTTYMTVSEGMGYGMLLAVLFAGHDPNARQLFDGLLSVVRTRYAYGNAQSNPVGKYLMDWRLYANGSSAGQGWNAMDGDLDIAMALLMADRQWGSSGTWNYLQEGKNTIGALKAMNMKTDGTTMGLANSTVSRTSDYMIGHFRAFAAATGDSFWNTAIDRAYALADRMQTVYSAGVGLMPDFVVGTDTSTPYPSPGYMGDGDAYENDYWWNACRNPWRYSSDYLLSGDTRWKTITARLISFFQAQVNAHGGDVTSIGTGYNLSGAMLTGGNSGAYHGPICAGACIDATYQTFLDAMWNWNASHLTTGYYDSELQLLSLVVASGNWWSPLGKTGTASGGGTSGSGTSGGSSPSTTAANVLTNGNFASGMTGWSDWGNAAIVGGALHVGTNAGGCGQDVTAKLTAGKTYALTGAASITSAAEGVFIGVKLLDATGAALVAQSQLVSATATTPVSVKFTVPAGVASATIYVWKNANSAYGVVNNLSLAAVA